MSEKRVAKEDDSLTSVCSVCSSPAAPHLHYGAVSCYSCRAFFRRGQPKQVRCIFGHGQCEIGRQNRTNCKLCRYRKCLEVGMKPEKVDHYLNKRKEREARMASSGENLDSEPLPDPPDKVPGRSPPSKTQKSENFLEITKPTKVSKEKNDTNERPLEADGHYTTNKSNKDNSPDNMYGPRRRISPDISNIESNRDHNDRIRIPEAPPDMWDYIQASTRIPGIVGNLSHHHDLPLHYDSRIKRADRLNHYVENESELSSQVKHSSYHSPAKSPAYSEFEEKHFRNSQANYSNSPHSKNQYDQYSSFRNFKNFQHLNAQPQQINSPECSERNFLSNLHISPNKKFQMEMYRYAGKQPIGVNSKDMDERRNTNMEYPSSLDMSNHPFSRNLESADIHQNDIANSDHSFVKQQQINTLGFNPRSTHGNVFSPLLTKSPRTESIFINENKNRRCSYPDNQERDFDVVNRSPPSIELNPLSRHIVWNIAKSGQTVFPEEHNVENSKNEFSAHSSFPSRLVLNNASSCEAAEYTEDSYINRSQSSDQQRFSPCFTPTRSASHDQQPVTLKHCSLPTQFQETNPSSVIRYEKSSAVVVSQLSELKSENTEPDSELEASHVMTPSVQTSVIKWNHSGGPKQPGETCDRNIKEEKEVQKVLDYKGQNDENSNGDFKISIPKRKTSDPLGCNSESDEDQSQKTKASIVPLKKRQRMLEIPYATGHAVNQKVLPVMSFTFEEEFQIADYIVRIQHYQNQRFEFVCRNFPKYKELTAAFIAFTQMGRKIPFNLQIEKMLVNIGLEFTKQTCKDVYKEMASLTSEVRREILNSTYPALYVVMWAILEGNTKEKTWMEQHRKTLHITQENHAAMKDNIQGLEKVRSISLKDQERFTSPWAVDMADEEKFERTISIVGKLLRDDLQLQALYHMLVMMCPSYKCSEKIQTDRGLADVQVKLSHLIYRYLSTKGDKVCNNKSGYSSEDSDGARSTSSVCSGSSIMNLSDEVDDLNPDEKTRLLLTLVDDLHDCVNIMQNRSLLLQNK